MGKRFKGVEKVYNQDGITVRVRMYETSEGKLEKIVMINGNKNVVLTPAELLVMSDVVLEFRSAIEVAGCMTTSDPLADLVKVYVLPYALSKNSDRAHGSWKLDAIKKYRAITNAGLKDSKEAVEYMETFGFAKWYNRIWLVYKASFFSGCDLDFESQVARNRLKGMESYV